MPIAGLSALKLSLKYLYNNTYQPTCCINNNKIILKPNINVLLYVIALLDSIMSYDCLTLLIIRQFMLPQI